MVLRPLLRRAWTVLPSVAWLVLFVPLALGGQSGRATQSDSAAVADMLRRFLTAFEDLEWEPFRAAFADSATVFHPAANMAERVTGAAAIDSTFRAVFADVRAHATSGPPFQRLTPVDLRIQPLAPGSSSSRSSFATPSGSDGVRSSSVAKAPRGESSISTPPTSRPVPRANHAKPQRVQHRILLTCPCK